MTNVTQGQTDVIMEQLELSVEQGENADGTITIDSLKLDRTGEGDDSDVSLVKLLESEFIKNLDKPTHDMLSFISCSNKNRFLLNKHQRC